MPKLFAERRVVSCRHLPAIAANLTRQWQAGLALRVRDTIHRVQPRRKSVYLALLVLKRLYELDPLYAEHFIYWMNPDKKGKKP